MQNFTPQNPSYEQVVRDSFSRQPFMALMGARMGQVAPGRCDILVDWRHDLTQQHGFFHGGMVSSIADSAAGYAAYTLFPKESTVLTVDFKVSFLNPSKGDHILASAEVIRAGEKIYHVKAEVFAFSGEIKTHCLSGIFTMMCLQGKSDAVNLGRKDEVS
ncbi:PaaI family thioesterase [Sneathiella aquimaris]|uniref:PaaI family thioesterase n=1 Tax=Sneathiella aquimaris TaxID=2599305 RepID=UPI00146DBB36|nr:PaaI family thioesterase [Sneathiella aquimaris]